MVADDTGDVPHKEDNEPFAGSGGLYDGFEEYRSTSDTDYQRLLTGGLVVLDTNVLLNLYRYTKQARDDMLSVLRSLENRLWIPNQAIVEFWDNRAAMLRDPHDTIATNKALSVEREEVLRIIRVWSNRVGLPHNKTESLTDAITGAFESTLNTVHEVAEKDSAIAAHTVSDPILMGLESLLDHRVGSPLSEGEYKDALYQAGRRATLNTPPGYRDIVRGGVAGPGDYLVWMQILHEAKRRRRDVLFVTGDLKDDWWLRDRSQLRGPRPELIEEMKSTAGVRLYMLQPESLLQHAQHILQVRVHDESVEDVEHIDRIWGEADNATLTLDLELLRRSWREIVGLVKARRKVAEVILGGASPSKVSGNTVTLEFHRLSEAEDFTKRGLDKVVAETIRDLFNIEITISVVTN